jgi:outer membrane immunogenic protein
MKRFLLTSVAITLMSGSALAADLAPQTYTKATLVNPGVNWTGFYIGAMGGYGWSDQVRARIGGLNVSACRLWKRAPRERNVALI